MTSAQLAKALTIRLKKRVWIAEIEPIAKLLGKEKVKKSLREGVAHYEWEEEEISLVVSLL